MSQPNFWYFRADLDPNQSRYPEQRFIKWEDYAALAAENERLRKAGDAMAKHYFELYWILNAESTSRHEPASITDWEAAKEGGRK